MRVAQVRTDKRMDICVYSCTVLCEDADEVLMQVQRDRPEAQ